MRNKAECSWGPRVAFWIIALMHDNRFLARVKNPHAILKTAGLSPGQQVLEVGCGPGFFTLPAAAIVGAHGHVYAVDVNPWAIRRVREKLAAAGAKNVTARLANAAQTDLPNRSLDLAFLFGLPRIAGGRAALVRELARTLKPGAAAVFQSAPRRQRALLKEMDAAGFVLEQRQGRLLIFRRQRDCSEKLAATGSEYQRGERI